MIGKILKLGKETAIYGLSSIVGRFLFFLLVPLYTNFLLPSEYGIIATLYSYIAFLQIVYNFGFESAYMRFIAMPEIGTKKDIFSTPFLSLIATSFACSIVLHTFAYPVAMAIGLRDEQVFLVHLTAWVMFFDALSSLPFAALRMNHKAMQFAAIRVVSFIINILLNIFFIVGLKMKSDGVLLANLISSGLTFLILLPVIAGNFSFKFSGKVYIELIRFGLPTIPAGIAGIAMQVVDRPILKMLTDDTTVGIYQANYRLGIVMMLFVGMFDYAWRPFFLNHANDDDAKELFSRIFSYLTLALLLVFLLVTLFIEDIVHISISGFYVIHPSYWSGLYIIPWVLLAYVFLGAYTNFIVGVHLQKKTYYLPYVTGAGALINIAANFYLIPVLDILGAALATLLSYIVMAAGMYFVSQRLYPLRYEWRKVAFSALSASIIFIVFKSFDFPPLEPLGILAKFFLLGLFLLLLLTFKVITPREVNEGIVLVRSAIRRSKSKT
jgi:O-antigen/teichoic acid export membrane protein